MAHKRKPGETDEKIERKKIWARDLETHNRKTSRRKNKYKAIGHMNRFNDHLLGQYDEYFKDDD